MPKVMELRDFLKKTGFIKVSKINQVRKYSKRKSKIPTAFSVSIYESRLLDKHLVLELLTINFRHFKL